MHSENHRIRLNSTLQNERNGALSMIHIVQHALILFYLTELFLVPGYSSTSNAVRPDLDPHSALSASLSVLEEAPFSLRPTPDPEPERPIFYCLMFHHVVEDGVKCNDATITTSRLRENLQWLSDHGYTTVLPSELARGEPLPERAVLITFDDGYASNYYLAFPILQEFNAKAVISVVTEHVDRRISGFLTWKMCQELVDSGLVEIGSHTHFAHTLGHGICRLPDEAQEAYEERIFTDLQTSIDLIESNLGTKVHFFAYPGGMTDPWANSFLKEHFAVTVTTRNGPIDISNGLYDLPRYNIEDVTFVSMYLPE